MSFESSVSDQGQTHLEMSESRESNIVRTMSQYGGPALSILSDSIGTGVVSSTMSARNKKDSNETGIYGITPFDDDKESTFVDLGDDDVIPEGNHHGSFREISVVANRRVLSSRADRFDKGVNMIINLIDKLVPRMRQANEALGRMNQMLHAIPEDDILSLIACEKGIIKTISQLFHQSEDCVTQVNTALDSKNSYLNHCRSQIQKLNEQIEVLEANQSGAGELSQQDRLALELFGCENVEELCELMNQLQGQLDTQAMMNHANSDGDFNRTISSSGSVPKKDATSSSGRCPDAVESQDVANPKDADEVLKQNGGGSKPVIPEKGIYADFQNQAKLVKPKPTGQQSLNGSPLRTQSELLPSTPFKKPEIKDYPMPEKFKGKNRSDFEKFLYYFESSMKHKGITGECKTDLLGEYLTGTLKTHHYHLVRKSKDFDEVKEGLLRVLGSDNKLSLLASRADLQRLKKGTDQSYEDYLKLVEDKANEAFVGQEDMLEEELKTALFRATQDDRDSSYYALILTQASESYLRLKELVISSEIPKRSHASNQPSRQNLNREKFSNRDSNSSWMKSSNDFSKRDSNTWSKTSSDSQAKSFRANVKPPVTCFACQKPGHYSNNCPSALNSNRVPLSSNRDDNKANVSGIYFSAINAIKMEEYKLLGERTDLDVWIGKVKVGAVLDTGAVASVISHNTYLNLAKQQGDVHIPIEDLPKESKRLVGASGSPLDIKGIAKFPIAWGIYPPKILPFHVAANLSDEVIIGTNVLKGDKGWREAVMTSLMSSEEAGIDKGGPSDSSHQVTSISRVTIAACTTSFVRVKVPESDYPLLVESDLDSIKSGIVQTPRGFAWLECSNYSTDDYIIEKGEVIGEAKPVEIFQASKIENPEPVFLIKEEAERKKTLLEMLKFNSNLSEEGKSKLFKLIGKNHEAFALTDDEFGRTDLVEHTIETGNARPIKQAARPVPAPLVPEVKKLVDNLAKQGIIGPSNSPWNSPLVLVTKKDGSIRMCVDYRKLNEVTKKDSYPVPNQDAILLSLKGKKFYTVMDVKSGFYSVPVSKQDREKTAFSVLGQHWEHNMVAMGMTTSPATFNRMMEKALHDIMGEGLWKFFDDLLIATETEEEHLRLLEKVFQRLISAKIKLAPAKCEFAQAEIVYLGHVLSERGLEMGKDKITKVANFPVPKNAKQMKQFLGLASYHRKFIPCFSKIASPLNELTKKDQNFHWGTVEQNAFEFLKGSLIKAPILSQPDYVAAQEGSRPFVVWTDACKTGVGAVLTQADEKGFYHPLYYVSKSCSSSERNYSITQLEALAVVVAMRKLRMFIFGAHVVVKTDHQPLVGLLKNGNLTSQLVRWALELQEFPNLRIEFVQGRANVVADALSRAYSDSEPGDHTEILDSVVLAVVTDDNDQSWWEMLSVDEQWKDVCKKLSEGDSFSKGSNQFSRKDGFLIQTDSSGIERKVVPCNIRFQLWKERHSGTLGCHMGAKKMSRVLRKDYFWLKLDKDVAKWTKDCMVCFAHNSHQKDRPKLNPFGVGHPMECIGMDIAEMPLSAKGFKYVLVIVDQFTKFATAWPLLSKTAEEVARVFLENWCLREQRIPKTIVSDLGKEFNNKVLGQIHKLTGSEVLFTFGYNSQFNGLSERFIQTLKRILAKKINPSFEWSEALPFALFSYNTTPHSATKETPHFLLHGFDARVPSEIDSSAAPSRYQADIEDYKQEVLENLWAAQQVARETLESYRKSMEDSYNAEHRTHESKLKIGDLVYVVLPAEQMKNVLSKLASKLEGPARVLRMGKTHAFVKFLFKRTEREVHLSQLVKWKGEPEAAKELAGKTSRTFRPNNINYITFRKSIDVVNSPLSDDFKCVEGSCGMGYLLAEFWSSTEDEVNPSFTIAALLQKFSIMLDARITLEDKKLIVAGGKLDLDVVIPKASMQMREDIFKFVLRKCGHRRLALETVAKKKLENCDGQEDLYRKLFAWMKDARFCSSSSSDSMIFGGENARILANAMGSTLGKVSNLSDVPAVLNVVLGQKFKKAFIWINDDHLFDVKICVEECINIWIQAVKQFESLNNVNVIIIPVFRRIEAVKRNQAIVDYFREHAVADKRIIGFKEVDEKRLYHFLEATPGDRSLRCLDRNSKITEKGIDQLQNYFASFNLGWESKIGKKGSENVGRRRPFHHFRNYSPDRGSEHKRRRRD